MKADDLISKTQRKKQMHDLQALGAALTKLSHELLARLDLPEALREAVADAKRFTRHEAARRQMQFIGRIMRDLEVGPIAAQVEALHTPTSRQNALFHLAERWRDEFLADPSAIARFVAQFPAADPGRLRELAGAAAEERNAERSPRRFRELFHAVNAIIRDHAKPAE